MKSSDRSTPILDLVLLVYKNIKKLTIFNGAVGIIALIFVFTLTLSYRSTAVVVVQTETGGGNIAAMISQFSPFSFGLGGGTETQKYMGILETNRVMDVIIDKYDLQTRYKKRTRVETYKAILLSMDLFDREDGSFSISFTVDEDPALARDIVETLYEELVKIMLELNQANAHNYRIYVEDAYKNAASTLKNSEIAFNDFQKRTGIVKIEDQVSATIEVITQLEMEKIQREIEINYMKEILAPDHHEVLNKIIELRTFKDKLADLKSSNESYMVAMESLPDNSLEYVRNFRNVTIDSKIAEFLALQLEQARIEEQKGTVNLYLLDPPQIPDRKFEPKRLSILIIIMFFSVVFSVTYLLIKNYFDENNEIIQNKLH